MCNMLNIMMLWRVLKSHSILYSHFFAEMRIQKGLVGEKILPLPRKCNLKVYAIQPKNRLCHYGAGDFFCTICLVFHSKQFPFNSVN